MKMPTYKRRFLLGKISEGETNNPTPSRHGGGKGNRQTTISGDALVAAMKANPDRYT